MFALQFVYTPEPEDAVTVVEKDEPVSPLVGPLWASAGAIKVVKEDVALFVVAPAPVASTQ